MLNFPRIDERISMYMDTAIHQADYDPEPSHFDEIVGVRLLVLPVNVLNAMRDSMRSVYLVWGD